jgi:hypothetical protein
VGEKGGKQVFKKNVNAFVREYKCGKIDDLLGKGLTFGVRMAGEGPIKKIHF